jgi:hypothetical protein
LVYTNLYLLIYFIKKSKYLNLLSHLCQESDQPQLETPWNKPIHQILKTIDAHNHEYFESSDKWHLQKADNLRQYLNELKTWICDKENNNK